MQQLFEYTFEIQEFEGLSPVNTSLSSGNGAGDDLEVPLELGAVFAEISQVHVVTVAVRAPDAVAGAQRANRLLRSAGITAVRLMPDLVSLNEVGGRLEVTRQTASNWARGDRHKGKFPPPYVPGDSRLWYWPEVVQFCVAHEIQTEHLKPVSYPSRQELAVINGALVQTQQWV